MKGSLSLGKIAGISLFIHWTFLILIGWVIYMQLSSGGTLTDALYMVLFVAVLFVCVTLHEFGHALMAKKYGIATRDITLLPIGGLARLERMPEDPKQELSVAFAGPAVNIVIAAVLFLTLTLTDGFADDPLESINGQNFLDNLFRINILLVVFNLIPAFPMDGGRVLRAFLAMKFERPLATKIAARTGQFFAILFVLAGFLPGMSPFLILIGIFVFVGAQAESNYVDSQSLLKGYLVKDVIMHKYFTLPLMSTIQDAVKILLETQSKDFLIMDADRVAGILRRNDIIRALADIGPTTPVSEVMTTKFEALHPSMPLTDIYQKIQEHKEMFLPVVENGELLGIVDTDNILEFLMIKGALAHK